MKSIYNILRKKIVNKLTIITAVIITALTITNDIYATTNETINPGSYIINMGVTPQTVGNGLKPYGLLYELIVNENIPVRWAINESKSKDGTDFTVDGVTYKGSAFIIPVEYVNGNVTSLISTWQSQGVVISNPTVNTFVAPVYKELSSWPRAVLDDQNDDKIKPYYVNAGVPSSSYVLNGDPTQLSNCGDIYVMPHADPHDWSQAEKTALINFIKNDQGYLWAGCHAVSSLEGMVSGANFLSEEGLRPWDDHTKEGTPPYTYAYHGDPIMQFMGEIDDATLNGSEQIYMPWNGKNWRSSTKLAAYDQNHPQADANEAAVLIYGHAFGNTNYGMVMYEGGHELDKDDDPDNIAAQRAFFNFILLAGVDKSVDISTSVPPTVPTSGTVSLTSTVSGGNPAYTYEWTSSCGGTFSNPTGATTNYTAPTVGSNTQCNISLKVTDDCGRENFETTTITITTLVGPTAVDDNATTPMNTAVNIPELDNDIAGDAALDPTSIIFVANTAPPVTTGVFTVDGTTGLVTFTPATGYTGSATIDYEVCDLNGLCDDATITVVITTVTGPTAVDDNATTEKNTPVTINELTNDIIGDAALDPTSVTFVPGTEPETSKGVFTKDGTTGIVTFTPANNYLGDASIDYEVCDLNGLCDIATITVNIIEGTTNFYPATGFGTLAYEDLWPGKGDYDFNDLVIDYQFEIITNTSNFVESVVGTFTIKAIGASFENGFGFQFPSTITASDLTVSGYSLTENIVTLDGNGTEANQSAPTIIVFDNVYNEMLHPGGAIGVNTEVGAPYVTPVTITINITFKPNTYTYNDLDISSFNPFIFVNLDRTVEVHLPDYEPTDLADQSLFGNAEDDSNPATGKYYKTVNNLPWAIHIYESFDYPIEKQEVVWAYLKFAEWAESNGSSFQDWYKDLQGYRNSGLIYTIP